MVVKFVHGFGPVPNHGTSGQGHIYHVFVAIIGSALILSAEPALALCKVTDAFTQKVNFGGVAASVKVKSIRVSSYSGEILHFRSRMNVNTDGAPNSYHLDGMSAGAMNTLCNGANIILDDKNTKYVGYLTTAERDKLKKSGATKAQIRQASRDKCSSFSSYLQQARKGGWKQDSYPLAQFYAVAEKNGAPCEIKEGPWKGFLVSTAAVADSSAPVCSPARWLDATRFSAIVIPKNTRFTSPEHYAIYNGNLAFVRYDGRAVRAIVGDLGPTEGLGEGTPKLGWELNNVTKDVGKMNAKQLQHAMKEAQIDELEVDYFVLVDSSVAYPSNKPKITPDKLKHQALNNTTIDQAFEAVGHEAIRTELSQCKI